MSNLYAPGHSMGDQPCSACGDLDGCHIPARIRDNKLSLEEFWDAHAEWSQATFGTDKERGPAGPLKHLVKEVLGELFEMDAEAEVVVAELLSKLTLRKQPTDDALEEYGDILFLAFDATRRAGFTFEQLRVQVNKKLKVNKSRQWQARSANDPVEHVRG